MKFIGDILRVIRARFGLFIFKKQITVTFLGNRDTIFEWIERSGNINKTPLQLLGKTFRAGEILVLGPNARANTTNKDIYSINVILDYRGLNWNFVSTGRRGFPRYIDMRRYTNDGAGLYREINLDHLIKHIVPL